MAQYFGVDASQGSDEFLAVIQALDTVQTDFETKGRGDKSLGSSGRKRAGDNGLIGDKKRWPWIMSTTEWLMSNPPKGLTWEVNPSEIGWSLGQRSMHTKTVVGTVLHVWPNAARNTFFDEPRLTFNLQSGNIMPVRVNPATSTFEPSGGIANFYDFMQLVDAPKLTVGSANQPPRANMVVIQYYSNLFPKLTLMGMFDPAGIRFSDTSTDNQINGWSADFIVYQSIPKLSSFNGQQTNPLIGLWDTILNRSVDIPSTSPQKDKRKFSMPDMTAFA